MIRLSELKDELALSKKTHARFGSKAGFKSFGDRDQKANRYDSSRGLQVCVPQAKCDHQTQCDKVKGGLAQIDTDRFNLHGEDPPSGFLPTPSLLLLASLTAGHTIIAI
jgi:hypothetical protein